MKKQDLDFKLEQFKRLSTAFSLNEGKPVFVDGKHWTSHEFFSMLGQLKLESNAQSFVLSHNFQNESHKSQLHFRKKGFRIVFFFKMQLYQELNKF